MGQLFKNTASQKLRVFAFADAGHATLDPGEPVTGDAANISAQTALDNAALGASNDVAPTEVDVTNAPGTYEFDPTQGETNGNVLEWYPKSSTAGVQVVTIGGNVQTLLPPNLPSLGIESDGHAHADVKQILGQAPTLSSDNRLRVDAAEWNDIPLSTTNPLPNVAADGAGGLPISDAGGLDMDAILARMGANTDAATDPSAASGTLFSKIRGAGNDLDTNATLISTTDTNVQANAANIATLITNVGTVLNRLGAFTGTGVNTILGFFRALFRTDATLPSDIAGTFDPSTDSLQANRDNQQTAAQAALDATVADSVPADGTRPSVSQAAYMLVQVLTEMAISGTTLTVKKPDGSTTLFACTLNDATDPTSITRAS